MARFLGLVLVPALLGWSLAAAPVAAQNRSSFVFDEAGFFSKEAVSKANAEIAQMRAEDEEYEERWREIWSQTGTKRERTDNP